LPIAGPELNHARLALAEQFGAHSTTSVNPLAGSLQVCLAVRVGRRAGADTTTEEGLAAARAGNCRMVMTSVD